MRDHLPPPLQYEVIECERESDCCFLLSAYGTTSRTMSASENPRTGTQLAGEDTAVACSRLVRWNFRATASWLTFALDVTHLWHFRICVAGTVHTSELKTTLLIPARHYPDECDGC
jgi:hypothetical protein